MKRHPYGVLDLYRLASAGSLADQGDSESIAIVEEALLETYGPTIANCAEHLQCFKNFLSAIERSPSKDKATHSLFFKWPTFLERFKNSVDRDRDYPLLDISNDAVGNRLKLAEIAPNLSRSLFASAADHSAKSLWLLLREIVPVQPQADWVFIFLNLRDKDTALFPHALFTLGDHFPLEEEVAHV